MIKALGVPGNKDEAIRLPGVGRNAKDNWVTVLIGENGTRKSFILRELALAGLDASMPFDESALKTSVRFAYTPSNVLAVSATATDRFPTKSRRGENRLRSRYDRDDYVYIGPRSARNIVSRSQSAAELIFRLLTNPAVLIDKRDVFERTFSIVGISRGFGVVLEHRWIGASRGEERLLAYLEAQVSQLSLHSSRGLARLEKARRTLEQPSFKGRLESFQNTLMERTTRTKRSRGVFVQFDVSTGHVDSQGLDLDLLALSVDVGYLRTSDFVFGDLGDQESLSAGQWAMFSSILSIAAASTDRSLILVDEPENGLHPEWQQQFISLALAAISHREQCHMVIATHAPLIVGSAPYKTTRVVALKHDQQDISRRVTWSLKSAPFGWDASDILQDVFGIRSSRNVEITNVVESALKLIAAGIESNRRELTELTPLLRRLSSHLEPDDPLSPTIRTITEIITRG